MTKLVFSILLGTCLWLSAEAQTPAATQPPVSASAETNPIVELLHHSLQVQLDPINEIIEVQDQLRLPNAWRGQQLQFELNAALTITSILFSGVYGGAFGPSIADALGAPADRAGKT